MGDIDHVISWARHHWWRDWGCIDMDLDSAALASGGSLRPGASRAVANVALQALRRVTEAVRTGGRGARLKYGDHTAAVAGPGGAVLKISGSDTPSGISGTSPINDALKNQDPKKAVGTAVGLGFLSVGMAAGLMASEGGGGSDDEGGGSDGGSGNPPPEDDQQQPEPDKQRDEGSGGDGGSGNAPPKEDQKKPEPEPPPPPDPQTGPVASGLGPGVDDAIAGYDGLADEVRGYKFDWADPGEMGAAGGNALAGAFIDEKNIDGKKGVILVARRLDDAGAAAAVYEAFHPQ